MRPTECGRRATFALVVLLAAAGLAPAQPFTNPLATPPGDLPVPRGGTPSASPDLTFVWRDGLFVESKRKNYSVHLGGVVQFDGSWFSAGTGVQDARPGGVGRLPDGVDFRRARFRAEGVMYGNVEFSLEVEFSGGFNPTNDPASIRNTFLIPNPFDVYAGLMDVPYLGTVRVGNQREPISLEHLAGARFLTFMERSPLFDLNPASAFNTGRSPGILALRTFADDRVFAAGGVFKNVTDVFGFGIGDGQYAATGRLTGLPVWKPDEHVYWHVGGAASARDSVDGTTRVRVRNDIRNGPGPLTTVVADTGAIAARSQNVFSVETAAVYGPVTVQAEYMANVIRGAGTDRLGPVGDVLLHGWYAEALYFLTGESRPWRTRSATFDRVRPRSPLAFADGRPTGFGAWEVAARYSHLDLNDKGVRGGRLNSVTLGVNWYWNPNAKMQFNYDYLYRDQLANPDARGSIHAFGTRLAYDF